MMASLPKFLGFELVVLAGVAAGGTAAQGYLGLQQSYCLDGSAWNGPYDWSAQVEIPSPYTCSASGEELVLQQNEFAHATLLPTGLHAGKVLIWNYVEFLKWADPDGDGVFQFVYAGCDDYSTTRSWLFTTSTTISATSS